MAGSWIASFLSPATRREGERRRAHLIALLLVAVVATAQLPAGAASRIVFVLEGLSVAALVAVLTRRLRASDARVVELQGENDQLCARLVAQDLSRRRETEVCRDAALRAQVALQKVADDAQGQFEALEALTDPLVNPIAGLGPLAELLERLRSTMHADGVAVVQLGQTGTRVISGAGLRHAQVRAPGAAAVGNGAVDGRVALVHNDAARAAQVSALTWPPTVSSIMVVPVGQTGPAGFRIEVVNERLAPATEWDLALARIVADRLARVVAFQIPPESSAAPVHAADLVAS
jgi:hypothetical protein